MNSLSIITLVMIVISMTLLITQTIIVMCEEGTFNRIKNWFKKIYKKIFKKDKNK